MPREKSETIIIEGWLKAAVYIIGYSAITGTIIVIPTFIIWNWIMPKIFKLPRINIFEAWGLIFLSGLFFKTRASFDREGN